MPLGDKNNNYLQIVLNILHVYNDRKWFFEYFNYTGKQTITVSWIKEIHCVCTVVVEHIRDASCK